MNHAWEEIQDDLSEDKLVITWGASPSTVFCASALLAVFGGLAGFMAGQW